MIKEKNFSTQKYSMGTKLVPPDGGWGWLIVVAYSVNMICTIPIIQSFGLLFRNICTDIDLSATDISIIISLNSAFGMALGLINGPLLRYFGYRKIAIVGATCYAVGLTLSSLANSFTYLIITYGILCSLGNGISNSAFSLALNSYFLKKRGRAVGLAMTLNGLGPILAPQLISVLISYYGERGTIFILGAISFHALVGAFTLQPIAWHLKEIEDVSQAEGKSQDVDEGEKMRQPNISASCEDLGPQKRKRTMTMSSIDHDVSTGNIYGFETLVPRKKSTSYMPVIPGGGRFCRRSVSLNEAAQPPPTPTEILEPAYKWWSSGKSLDTINLGSSIKVFDESYSRLDSVDLNRDEIQSLMQKTVVDTVEEEEENESRNHRNEEEKKNEKSHEQNKKESASRRALHSIVVFFDFDLLHDPIYVNIMVGMSIAMFSELNFAILTPFILGEMQLDTEQIATVMSCLAVTDLIFRGVAPFIGEWLNQTARMMYLISLIVLVTTRSGLLFAKSFTSILIIGCSLGIGKAIRSVNMTLVISNYVPIEKLASASGIQMVTNGLILVIVGPILGVIKDETGSYNSCILFINGISILAIAMWTIEMTIKKFQSKPSSLEMFENGLQKTDSQTGNK